MALLPPGSRSVTLLPDRHRPTPLGRAADAREFGSYDPLPPGRRPSPAHVARLYHTANPLAAAYSPSFVVLPNVTPDGVGGLLWRQVDAMDVRTMTPGPSYSIPDSVGEVLGVGVSLRYVYLMAYAPADEETDNAHQEDELPYRAIYVYRAPVTGGAWVLYAHGSDFEMVVPTSASILSQIPSINVHPLANCGVDPETDTLWFPVRTKTGPEAFKNYLVRKLADEIPDLSVAVATSPITLDTFSRPAPFWYYTEDLHGIVFFTDDAVTIPLPDPPDEAGFDVSCLHFSPLSGGRYALLYSPAFGDPVLMLWIRTNGAWERQEDVPVESEFPGGVTLDGNRRVKIGGGPYNERWNMGTLRLGGHQSAAFFEGASYDGVTMTSRFSKVPDQDFTEVPTYDGRAYVDVDSQGVKTFLTHDVDAQFPQIARDSTPVHFLSDGSVLVKGFRAQLPKGIWSDEYNGQYRRPAGPNPGRVFVVAYPTSWSGPNLDIGLRNLYAGEESTWVSTPSDRDVEMWHHHTASDRHVYVCGAVAGEEGGNVLVLRRSVDAQAYPGGVGEEQQAEVDATWELFGSLSDLVSRVPNTWGANYSPTGPCRLLYDTETKDLWFQAVFVWSGDGDPQPSFSMVFRKNTNSGSWTHVGMASQNAISFAGPGCSNVVTVAQDCSSFTVHTTASPVQLTMPDFEVPAEQLAACTTLIFGHPDPDTYLVAHPRIQDMINDPDGDDRVGVWGAAIWAGRWSPLLQLSDEAPEEMTSMSDGHLGLFSASGDLQAGLYSWDGYDKVRRIYFDDAGNPIYDGRPAPGEVLNGQRTAVVSFDNGSLFISRRSQT